MQQIYFFQMQSLPAGECDAERLEVEKWDAGGCSSGERRNDTEEESGERGGEIICSGTDDASSLHLHNTQTFTSAYTQSYIPSAYTYTLFQIPST